LSTQRDAPLSGAPQGGAVQTRKYIYLEYNTINSKYYMKYNLKPSRIQD